MSIKHSEISRPSLAYLLLANPQWAKQRYEGKDHYPLVMEQLADMQLDPQETWNGVSMLEAFLLGMVNMSNGGRGVDSEAFFEVIIMLCKTPSVSLKALVGQEKHMYFERYPGGNALLRCLWDGVAPEIAKM
jgi:hypothetical protein